MDFLDTFVPAMIALGLFWFVLPSTAIIVISLVIFGVSLVCSMG